MALRNDRRAESLVDRIWGGIHYRFDINGSQASCTQVADYLFDNYMQPRRTD